MTQQHWLSILDALHGNIWVLPPTLNVRNKFGEHAEHMQFIHALKSTCTRSTLGSGRLAYTP